ncbi:hypothetical protein [Kineococcus xinjiangensis]|nr:hypothetical protein [Kineococcus xinjiangensis]
MDDGLVGEAVVERAAADYGVVETWPPPVQVQRVLDGLRAGLSARPSGLAERPLWDVMQVMPRPQIHDALLPFDYPPLPVSVPLDAQRVCAVVPYPFSIEPVSPRGWEEWRVAPGERLSVHEWHLPAGVDVEAITFREASRCRLAHLRVSFGHAAVEDTIETWRDENFGDGTYIDLRGTLVQVVHLHNGTATRHRRTRRGIEHDVEVETRLSPAAAVKALLETPGVL